MPARLLQELTRFNADPSLFPALEDLGSSLQVAGAALDVTFLQLEPRGAFGLLHGLVGWRSRNWSCSHLALISLGWRMRKRRAIISMDVRAKLRSNHIWVLKASCGVVVSLVP